MAPNSDDERRAALERETTTSERKTNRKLDVDGCIREDFAALHVCATPHPPPPPQADEHGPVRRGNRTVGATTADETRHLPQPWWDDGVVAPRRRGGLVKDVPLLVCDLGYGLPREARPRREKLLAIARQLVHFLHWQQRQLHTTASRESVPQKRAARMLIVLGTSTSSSSSISSNAKKITKGIATSCNSHNHTSLREALDERMREVWRQLSADLDFPDDIVAFTDEPLEVVWQEFGTAAVALPTQGNDCDEENPSLVYLSPDAERVLDPTKPPPLITIVALLIDRRTIQVNRSVVRAAELSILAARWPLESIPTLILHPNEPLNVDCVLEGMQQWHWNKTTTTTTATATTAAPTTAAFAQAAIQAIRHHQERHPERPRHKDLE